MKSEGRQSEALLEGFLPTFEFQVVDPLPTEEFEERIRALRCRATAGDYDGLLLHTDPIGWYHTSNSFLRYVCDWIREGLLVIPTDHDMPATLLTFYSPEALLPPPGEPTWVNDIRQVGTWGREKWARPGETMRKVCEAAARVLRDELRLARGKFGTVGDRTSQPYWNMLAELMPRAAFENRTEFVLRMQKVRSAREQALVRAAAQLIDIGVQAAHHVTKPGVTDHEIYAAFTYAQLARGGETGDGYQIGINKHGTHISKPYGHVVRPGDVINLYLSKVTYRGYDAQAARMIVVGETTQEQEELMAMCVEAVERAMAVARPGVPIREVNDAAFGPYIERGYLTSADARDMPYNLASGPGGMPLRVPEQFVSDPDWEAQGRRLGHRYPATLGPNAPAMGHSVSMAGMGGYTVISTNEERLQPGMTMVVHAQWFDPANVGCNLGNCLLITEGGAENLNAHSPLPPFRIPV